MPNVTKIEEQEPGREARDPREPAGKLRSPLPWMGGKYHMAPFILASFPDVSAYDVYVEHFAGACHVLMQKPVAHHYEAINDINGDLVNFWLTVRNSPEALLSRLASLPYSRELHYAYHRSLFDGSILDPIERAARWYYVLQSSFSAHLKPSSVGWKIVPAISGGVNPTPIIQLSRCSMPSQHGSSRWKLTIGILRRFSDNMQVLEPFSMSIRRIWGWKTTTSGKKDRSRWKTTSGLPRRSTPSLGTLPFRIIIIPNWKALR
jgi:hypothetical protein